MRSSINASACERLSSGLLSTWKGLAPEAPTTKVPTPRRERTIPAACSLDSASRTTVRLTPNSLMISASVGSLSPARSGPIRIRWLRASTTPMLRLLRGRDR